MLVCCLSFLFLVIPLMDYLHFIIDFSELPIFNNPASTTPEPISPSCPLPQDLCVITSHDPFLVSVTCWATLQLSWTIVLLASQLWQVARQMTTLEVSNLGRYGFMGGRSGASLAGQMGHKHISQHRHQSDFQTEDSTLVGSDASSVAPSHRHQHRSPLSLLCCCGSPFLMNLLGLDRFTKGKAVDGLARANKASNPFDLGLISNCKDFWTAGKELGVEYESLYDVPIEGFGEARRRRAERERERDDDDDGSSMVGMHSGYTGSNRKLKKGPPSGAGGLFMGLMGRGRSSRNGYEPVSQA